MIISHPECRYNEKNFNQLTEFKKKNLTIKFSYLKDIGTLDLKLIFNAIYNGFDGIFLIVKDVNKLDPRIRRFSIFQKNVNEANRILERRGFSHDRVNIFYLNCNNYEKLVNDCKRAIKKIIKCGKSPINNEIIELLPIYV